MEPAWQDLGAVQISQGRHADAIASLNAALRLSPALPAIHLLLAKAYGGLGNSQRAIAEVREALRLQPDNIAAHEDLANLLAKTGKDDKEAIFEFTVVLESQPTRADLWDKVGILYAAKNTANDVKTANIFFKQALQLDPTLTDAQKNADVTDQMLKNLAIKASTRPVAGTQP